MEDAHDGNPIARAVPGAAGNSVVGWAEHPADRSTGASGEHAESTWRDPQSMWETATTAPTTTTGPTTTNLGHSSPSVLSSSGKEGANASIRPSTVPTATTVPVRSVPSDHPVSTTTTTPTTVVVRSANPADARAGVRTVPVTTLPDTSSGVVRPVDVYRLATAAPPIPVEPPATTAAPRQAPAGDEPVAVPSKPISLQPPAPQETFPGAFGEPMVLARGAWQGLSLRAATELKVPISLLVAVAVFLLVQAFVDRRDPKVAAAPERGTDDTVGFQ